MRTEPPFVASELVWIHRKKLRPAVVLMAGPDRAIIVTGTGVDLPGERITVEIDSYEARRLQFIKTTHFYKHHVELVHCSELRSIGLRCPRRLFEQLRALEPTLLQTVLGSLAGSREGEVALPESSKVRRGAS